MSKHTKSKISIKHYLCVYGDSKLTSGIKSDGPWKMYNWDELCKERTRGFRNMQGQ